jgi:biotin carboxylase
MTKRILVTGAGGPAGVNFIRSLRISPERIFIVGSEANKYFGNLAPADRISTVPKATNPRYIERLNEIINREKVEFVHPQPDIEVKAISESREELDANTFLPSKEAIQICQDKLKSAERWKKKDIPVAKTIELNNDEDIERAFEELGNPLWIRARRGAGGVGSTPAENPQTARSWIGYWKSRNRQWQFIAQKILQGRNIGFHSLWKEGELITSMARERLQYIYPHLAPSGITGTPSVQRTLHDEKVNEIGQKAVLAIDQNFNGIACVDLKENKSGVPYVTEINAGRMFTTSFFFSYASKKLLSNYNSNFPYIYVKLAYREQIPNIPKKDVLPQDIYWIRHIDAPAKLVYAGKIVGAMYQ